MRRALFCALAIAPLLAAALAPSRMNLRGLSKDMLKAGEKASVEGYPNRSKAEEMRAERISIGGKTIELR